MGYKIAAISFSLRPHRRPRFFFFLFSLFVTPLLAFARLDKCHPAVRLVDGSEKNMVVYVRILSDADYYLLWNDV